MSRFGTTASRATPDVFTAVSGIAALIMVLGCVWLVFHNIEHSSSGPNRQDGGIFTMLD